VPRRSRKKSSWDLVREGGLEPSEHNPAPEEWIALYTKVMGRPRDLNFDDTSARFIVRQWDGMDGCWCDCTGAVDAKKALEEWIKYTRGGTEKKTFADIDYYRIFPAGTRMIWDGSDGGEMFR